MPLQTVTVLGVVEKALAEDLIHRVLNLEKQSYIPDLKPYSMPQNHSVMLKVGPKCSKSDTTQSSIP